MTPNTQALQRLLTSVETETLPEAVFFGVHSIQGHWSYDTGLSAEHRRLVQMAYNGSLDAAKALHEAMLPGWDLLITTYEDGLFEVSVSEPLVVKTYDGLSEIIARAWLIAIIRAVMAGER